MSQATARHLPAEIWRIIANLEAESTFPKDGLSSSNHQGEHRDDLLTGPVNTILDLKDRAKLSRVCKAARTALLPTLYQRLDLRRDGSQSLLRTLSNDAKLAALVQGVFWDISLDAALVEQSQAGDHNNSSPTLRVSNLEPQVTDPQQQQDGDSSTESIQNAASALLQDREERVTRGMAILKLCPSVVALRIRLDNGCRPLGTSIGGSTGSTTSDEARPLYSSPSDPGAAAQITLDDLRSLPFADKLTSLILHQTRTFRQDCLGAFIPFVAHHLPQLSKLTLINCIIDKSRQTLDTSLPELKELCLAFDPDNYDISLQHLTQPFFHLPNLQTLRYHIPQTFEEEKWDEFTDFCFKAIDATGCRESLTRLIGGLRGSHSPHKSRESWSKICDYFPNLQEADLQCDGHFAPDGHEIFKAVKDNHPHNTSIQVYRLRLLSDFSMIHAMRYAQAVSQLRQNVKSIGFYIASPEWHSNDLSYGDQAIPATTTFAEISRLTGLECFGLAASSSFGGYEDLDSLTEQNSAGSEES